MTTETMETTAEALLQRSDDGFRYELIRGALKRMSPAGHQHGKIAAILTGSLFHHVIHHDLGVVYAAETGFKLGSNPDHVRAPDVAFVRRERAEQAGNLEGYWPGAPDLAIEVISSDDNYTDVEDKVFDWLDAGTRLVIVINPRRHVVTVYRSLTDITMLLKNDVLDGGDVVPGWSIPVKEIFK